MELIIRRRASLEIREAHAHYEVEHEGSECTWIPAPTLERIGIEREKKDLQFTMANGTTITRSVGFVVIYVDNTLTTDEVVFAEKGDLVLLGARTLEGLNLTVDPRKKKLVGAGPLPAAAVRAITGAEKQELARAIGCASVRP